MKNISSYFPSYITERVLKVLHNAGFEAYYVGGCVRDALLDKEPKDFDITTSATPEEIRELIPNSSEKSLRMGTVMVKFDDHEDDIEITTFRVESDYKDGRRPEEVKFTRSLEEDLLRRDFTINALVYDGEQIRDLYGGLEDLENKLIRAVGNPDERFNEDYIRVLRGLRFALTLNFDIEENTFDSMTKFSDNLKFSSMDTIRNEFIKIFEKTKSYDKYIKVIELGAIVGEPDLTKYNYKKFNTELMKKVIDFDFNKLYQRGYYDKIIYLLYDVLMGIFSIKKLHVIDVHKFVEKINSEKMINSNYIIKFAELYRTLNLDGVYRNLFNFSKRENNNINFIVNNYNYYTSNYNNYNKVLDSIFVRILKNAHDNLHFEDYKNVYKDLIIYYYDIEPYENFESFMEDVEKFPHNKKQLDLTTEELLGKTNLISKIQNYLLDKCINKELNNNKKDLIKFINELELK